MEAQANNRARLVFAAGLAVAFAAVIGIVLVAGGGDGERDFAAAPEDCVERWNSEPAQLRFGRHNATSHGYSRVRVAYASEDGAEVSADPVVGGGCVVIFAAARLDPEPVSAAQINLDDRWIPLSASANPARLGELQGEALAEANAALAPDGRLSPL